MTAKIRDFWSSMPSTLRVSVIAIGGSIATIMGVKASEVVSGGSSEVKELREIRREVGRMNAGFKAFVETQPPKVKVPIYEAMNRYEDRQREGKP